MDKSKTPVTSAAKLRFRADLLRALREYFFQERLLEVSTPVLRAYGSSEVHLDNIQVGQLGYLQTSPEFAMKCLLAESPVSMFQVCPAFRGGETGARHRVEFQMLEWYRVGFSLNELMDDLIALLDYLVGELEVHHPIVFDAARPLRVSYKTLFEDEFCGDPHMLGLRELQNLGRDIPAEYLDANATCADYLDALFSLRVEPTLQAPTIVYDYPVTQAALAQVKTNEQGNLVSDRFEYYVCGMELANAYQELNDPVELRRRFDENNQLRATAGKQTMANDETFLRSIGELPRCAGIALGVDRLAMILLGAATIDEVN